MVQSHSRGITMRSRASLDSHWSRSSRCRGVFFQTRFAVRGSSRFRKRGSIENLTIFPRGKNYSARNTSPSPFSASYFRWLITLYDKVHRSGHNVFCSYPSTKTKGQSSFYGRGTLTCLMVEDEVVAPLPSAVSSPLDLFRTASPVPPRGPCQAVR